MISDDEKAQIRTQIALSKTLGLGFALSLVPAAGLGSIAAIWIGARALAKIRASEGRLVGGEMAWACLSFGFIGLIVNLFLLRMVLHPEK